MTTPPSPYGPPPGGPQPPPVPPYGSPGGGYPAGYGGPGTPPGPGMPPGGTAIPGAPYGMPVPPRRRGGAAGVLWALGGAAVASAVWAGLVFGAGAGGSDGPGRPRVAYRTVDDLCATADLAAFRAEYPKKDDDPTSKTQRSKSTDRMFCAISLEKTGDDDSHYLSVDVHVHRDADPTVEFRAERELLAQDEYEIADGPDLGDEAFFATRDKTDEDGYRSIYHELYIRDGGVVVTMSFSNGFGKNLRPADRDATRARLTDDARALLDKLRADRGGR